MDSMKEEYELSIAIPCKNELKGLPLLIERYRKGKGSIKFQLVIIDNTSNDGTGEYLDKEAKKPNNKFIKVVHIKNSKGYGDGIQQGLNNCDAEIIGWSHGDLQCPPEDVFRGYSIYRKLNNKRLFLKGKRRGRDWKSLFRSYWLDVFAMIILFRIYNDINGQPKIFHRDLLRTFRNPPNGFSYDLYVQDRALNYGYEVKSFSVRLEDRTFGLSKWTYSTIAKISTIKSYIKDIIKIKFGTIR